MTTTTQMNQIKRIVFVFTAIFSAVLFLPLPAEAQLRRPGIITIKHEDRNKSNLLPEKGAVYLQGLVSEDIPVKITKAGPAYSNLTGQRWLGNLLPNQTATLLAVSEKAYRVKAKAQQGQIAGWVSKSIVSGLPEGFEEKLVKFHERYELVKQLIDNKQVALGMTTDEVIASIGPPDAKSSQLDANGRKDVYDFISYTRTPQQYVGYDQFGIPTVGTRYVEVESGRVTIEFTNNLVSSINETAGLNFNQGIPSNHVPPFFPLF
ncbi:MAG: hypothetical protein P1U89_27695 [Verrucomicrobiales bacterium]|nr:hypothetical protein [Verrucomicrobiales bacterium]